jgi:hypothetical protein
MDSNRITVMVAGESIAAGWPSRSSGFRGKLARELASRPIEWVGPFVDENGLPHAGYHGHAAHSIYGQMEELVAFRPDVVLFSGGLNGLPDQSPEEVGEYVNAITNTFLANGTRAVHLLAFTDVRGLSERVALYNGEMKKVADECPGAHYCAHVGPSLGLATHDSPYFVDECHPSDLGYDKMADEILKDVFRFEGKPKAFVGAADMTPAELWRAADAAFRSAYPSLNDSVRQFALAIGYFETQFGLTGSWAPNGVPSNNWGALVYREGRDPGYFIHGDKDAQGNPTSPKFAKYPTLQEGAIAFFETWAKPNTYAAAAQGDTWGVAKAMYGYHYYTGTSGSSYERILAYARGIESVAVMGAGLLGEKPAVALNAPPAPSGTVTGQPFSGGNMLALAGAVGIFAATLLLKPGSPK